MALCCAPGCARNDDASDDTLFMEYLPGEDTWVVVCEKHLNNEHPNLEATDEVKETSVEVLTMLVDEVN